MTATELIDGYLRRLERAAVSLPAAERVELVADLEAHIRDACAVDGWDEAAVRTILDRLGTPEQVVAAARDGARASPLAAPYGAAHAAGTDPRIDGAAIAGLIVLLASPAVLPPVSILVGVLLVARSRAWTVWRKVLGVTAPVLLAVLAGLVGSLAGAVGADRLSMALPGVAELGVGLVLLSGPVAAVALAGLLWRPRRPPVADGRRAPGGVAMDG